MLQIPVEQDAFQVEHEYIQTTTQSIIALFNPNHIPFPCPPPHGISNTDLTMDSSV